MSSKKFFVCPLSTGTVGQRSENCHTGAGKWGMAPMAYLPSLTEGIGECCVSFQPQSYQLILKCLNFLHHYYITTAWLLIQIGYIAEHMLKLQLKLWINHLTIHAYIGSLHWPAKYSPRFYLDNAIYYKANLKSKQKTPTKPPNKTKKQTKPTHTPKKPKQKQNKRKQQTENKPNKPNILKESEEALYSYCRQPSTQGTSLIL